MGERGKIFLPSNQGYLFVYYLIFICWVRGLGRSSWKTLENEIKNFHELGIFVRLLFNFYLFRARLGKKLMKKSKNRLKNFIRKTVPRFSRKSSSWTRSLKEGVEHNLDYFKKRTSKSIRRNRIEFRVVSENTQRLEYHRLDPEI